MSVLSLKLVVNLQNVFKNKTLMLVIKTFILQGFDKNILFGCKSKSQFHNF